MKRPARTIKHDHLHCYGCKQPRPVDWFNHDKAMPHNRGYRCRFCRKKNRKLTLVEPDYEVVAAARVKLLTTPDERMSVGAWERVVQRAAICTAQETVVVHVGKNYLLHNQAYHGIMRAAKRMKMKVTVRHGANEVFVGARA